MMSFWQILLISFGFVLLIAGLNQIQKEWVETVANEAVDNLDIADIMDLIEGMEKFYGKELTTND